MFSITLIRLPSATCIIDVLSFITELIIPLINQTKFSLFLNLMEIIIKGVCNVCEVAVWMFSMLRTG